MRKWTRTAIVAAAAAGLAIAVTACGSGQPGKVGNEESGITGNATGASGSRTGDKGPARPSASAQEPPAEPGSGNGAAAKPGSAGGTGNGGAPIGDSGEAESKPLYRMNKAYRFEPIDEAAPAKVVLLTFDDGPKEAAMLTSMLDTLDKHKAKAIFFVNGYRAKKHPELLRLIADRGMTVGNHSWDHVDLRKETAGAVEKQIGDVQTLVEETIGKAPRFFRPPFGSGGDAVKEIVRKRGMLYMTWSNGSLDWDKSAKDKPDKVIGNVLDQLHPGANILMHELPWTEQALDELLARLEEKGYGFIDPAAIETERPS